MARTHTGFDELLGRLQLTRTQYEDARIACGSYALRARLLDELHDLRAQMAVIRGVR